MWNYLAKCASNIEWNEFYWSYWMRISRYWISSLKWPDPCILLWLRWAPDMISFQSSDRNNTAAGLTWADSWPNTASKLKVLEESEAAEVCLWGAFSTVICLFCGSSLKEYDWDGSDTGAEQTRSITFTCNWGKEKNIWVLHIFILCNGNFSPCVCLPNIFFNSHQILMLLLIFSSSVIKTVVLCSKN